MSPFSRTIVVVAGLSGAALMAPAFAQPLAKAVAPEGVNAAIARSWTGETRPDWIKRFEQDEMQTQCSLHRNAPPKDIADAIQAAAKASIEYPADGRLIGDWKKGETIAQNGYGGRFTDTDPKRANGGNCYACHQLDPKEVSYGTLGPPLREYGKIRKFADADAKAVYDKIYNSHAVLPCSNMPRFGVTKFLTTEQIRDLVALLMDPASPVNK